MYSNEVLCAQCEEDYTANGTSTKCTAINKRDPYCLRYVNVNDCGFC